MCCNQRRCCCAFECRRCCENPVPRECRCEREGCVCGQNGNAGNGCNGDRNCGGQSDCNCGNKLECNCGNGADRCSLCRHCNPCCALLRCFFR